MRDKSVSILIVDDDESTIDLMMALLGKDYTCVTASSAEEAIRLITPAYFNLVITDIRMPGASGLDVCNYVHEVSPDTVVMVVSGVTDIRYEVEALRRGTLFYIDKPFDPDKLFVLVESALRCQALAAARYHYERMLNNIDKELASLKQCLNATGQPAEKVAKAKA